MDENKQTVKDTNPLRLPSPVIVKGQKRRSFANEAGKNPQSLVDLLLMIRRQHARKTQIEFAKVLNKISKRNFGRGIGSRRILGKLERNDEFLTYAHLEVYREYLGGLPVGLLLLFSRMMANQRMHFEGKNAEQNSELARKVIDIMKRVTPETVFDVDELRRWLEFFEEPPFLDIINKSSKGA